MIASQQGWFTRERLLTLTLILATFLALYVCYEIVEPFIPAIAFALALAVATQGPYNRLRRRVPSEMLSATIAVILVMLLIIGPLTYLGSYLVKNAIKGINELRSHGGGVADWLNVLDRQPLIGTVVRWATEHLDVQDYLSQLGQSVAGQATDFLKGSANVVTQLGITVFVLFFMYRDQEAGLEALYRLVPLSRPEAGRIFNQVAETLRATVNGSLTVGAVQALLAGMMYAFLAVPGAVVWAALTFFAALVPVVGTSLIWGPITLYLLVIGSWGKALVLMGWGVLAIGMIDNVLYPFLVGDKLRMHTVPTFFSIMGGIAHFGPVGLILGPLTLAVMVGLIDIWWRRTAEGQPAEEEVVPADPTGAPPAIALGQPGS